MTDPAPSVRTLVEAVLLVADEPVTPGLLAEAVGASAQQVSDVLRELAAEYEAQERGFELREVGASWRLYTRTSCADAVERFVREGQQARLTQAALETLAVIAYRQPVSRTRISAVRGVNVDGVVRTLLARGLVREAGSDADTGATLYASTTLMLEKLGLTSLDELPALAPLVPEIDQVETPSTR